MEYLTEAVASSPDNLRWKVWLIASRSEYKIGNHLNARKLIERCLSEVPQKQMSLALLEYAKYFEMQGQVLRAR